MTWIVAHTNPIIELAFRQDYLSAPEVRSFTVAFDDLQNYFLVVLLNTLLVQLVRGTHQRPKLLEFSSKSAPRTALTTGTDTEFPNWR